MEKTLVKKSSLPNTAAANALLMLLLPSNEAVARECFKVIMLVKVRIKQNEQFVKLVRI